MATIRLGIRPQPFSLPSYSLTTDLLSYLRCGLQYRYSGIGRLPTSEPVQLWFGQFIHGVMEEAFRRYAATRTRAPEEIVFSDAEIDKIIERVESRLAAQGLRAWGEQGRLLGRDRARAAIVELGPSLFPLIHRAEVRLTGARRMLNAAPGMPERYEVAGVVDVISHVALRDPALAGNRMVRAITDVLGDTAPEQFEVIIDYKGTRRPAPGGNATNGLAAIYHWQVQTYAHLRQLQEDSLPVAAGIVLYLNELFPSAGDISKLRRECKNGTADVVPGPESPAAQLLATRGARATGDRLPIDFRIARAMQIVTISPESIASALVQFDGVVARIESCRNTERNSGKIVASWEHNTEDEGTCAACDARTYCPAYSKEKRPTLPGIG